MTDFSRLLLTEVFWDFSIKISDPRVLSFFFSMRAVLADFFSHLKINQTCFV